MMRVFLLTALVLLGWVSPAAAACNISLRNLTAVSFTSSQAYPVFQASDTGKAATFQVRHPSGQPACSYFVTFSKGGAATYSGRRMILSSTELKYQIYDSASLSSILKEVPDAVAGEVIAGTFSGTGLVTHDLSFYVNIPQQQVVAPNTYVDSITVRLYEGTLSSYTQRDSQTIQIRGQTVSTTQVCVGCVTAFDTTLHSHELNFGTLDTAEFKTGTVRVRSNDGYAIYLQSANRSVLKHATLASTVPYTATVNGTAVTLTGTSQVLIQQVSGATAAQGVVYDVKITIGSTTGALAGNYADAITVTVTQF